MIREHQKYGWPARLCQSFETRARAIGVAHLATNNPVARSAADPCSEPPRKALRASIESTENTSLSPSEAQKRRFLLWLTEAEAGVRNLMASIPGCWRSVCSGITCAVVFADNDCQGGHWEWPTDKTLRLPAYFRNGGTAENYLEQLSFALQFHPDAVLWDKARVARALRGARKATVVTQALASLASDTVKLGIRYR